MIRDVWYLVEGYFIPPEKRLIYVFMILLKDPNLANATTAPSGGDGMYGDGGLGTKGRRKKQMLREREKLR